MLLLWPCNSQDGRNASQLWPMEESIPVSRRSLTNTETTELLGLESGVIILYSAVTTDWVRRWFCHLLLAADQVASTVQLRRRDTVSTVLRVPALTGLQFWSGRQIVNKWSHNYFNDHWDTSFEGWIQCAMRATSRVRWEVLVNLRNSGKASRRRWHLGCWWGEDAMGKGREAEEDTSR